MVQHKVEKVLKSEEVKILSDFKVQTEKVLEHSRPNIVVLNKTKMLVNKYRMPIWHRGRRERRGEDGKVSRT